MITAVFSLGATLGSCQESSKRPNIPIGEILYTMPAESAPHEGTWLQWPHEHEYGKAYRDRIESVWIEMAREIVSGEKLHIIAYDAAGKARITDKLTKAGIPLDDIDFYIFKTDDVWVRDNGPIYVRDHADKLAVEGWGFNGWGNKAAWDYDNSIPQKIAAAEKMPYVDLAKQMIVEGGAFEVDGKGGLMATRSSILNKNRNPGMTQQQAEALFTTYLGATHFIWLDGVPGLEITDMHIDFLARFGENNTIITMSREDLAEADLPQKDIDYLYSVKNQDGEAYNYAQIPLTRNNVTTTYGKNLGYKGSYVNYYIANDRVLVPTYSDPNDETALAIIQGLYPKRRAVGIDVRNLYENGGMIHCVTQQQPR